VLLLLRRRVTVRNVKQCRAFLLQTPYTRKGSAT
jgi:hypothetical protein